MNSCEDWEKMVLERFVRSRHLLVMVDYARRDLFCLYINVLREERLE